MTRVLYPFHYPCARRDRKTRVRIHQRRDVGSSYDLMIPLLSKGYKDGDPILNFPAEKQPESPPTVPHELAIDYVQPGDYFVQTTRPPLFDAEPESGRKKVERAWTDVEERLFSFWRTYLKECSRESVVLSEAVRRELPKPYKDRCEIVFREEETAPYRWLNAWGARKKRPPKGRTAVFFLRAEQIWPGGPGLIAAFGMDGVSTTIWSFRLRRDFDWLLERPGFFMAEMHGPPIPTRPSNLRFAMDWTIEPIIDMPFGDGSRSFAPTDRTDQDAP